MRARTINTGPGSPMSISSAELARRERASRRRMTPAERLKVRWFIAGAVFTQGLNYLIALFVVAGAP